MKSITFENFLTLAFTVILIASTLGLEDAYAQKGPNPLGLCQAQSQIPNVECRALVELYKSTNGDSWNNNINWIGNYPCTWRGVTCESGNVKRINLNSNNLKGQIPNSIGAFKELELLELTRNQLHGSIPNSIGKLQNLRYLYLGDNQLSGSIPWQMALLSKLVILVLSQNELSGNIPIELAKLNTAWLDLSENKLSGSIPNNLHEATIYGFLLNDNNLSGVVSIENASMSLTGRCELQNNPNLCMPATDEYRKLAFNTKNTLCGIQLGDYICPVYLPVEISEISGTIEEGMVDLQWTTSSETNNAGFYIETKSNENDVWMETAFVDGAGTTSELQDYSYTIRADESTIGSVRLKQVDFDGSVEYSKVLTFTKDTPGGYSLEEAYPNPFNPQATFGLRVDRSQNARIEVVDALGRVVEVLHDGLLQEGQEHQFRFGSSDWQSGMYFYRVMGESFNLSKSVTLIK